ncbi:MAG: hypothetical protein WAV84_01065 [Bacteroidota bacterium]
MKRRFVDPLPGDAKLIAAAASYSGSPEHKNTLSFAGSPHPRRDASLCDIRFAAQQEMLTEWLRTAIGTGCCSAFGGGSFPKYVWYKEGDIVYEARLVNAGTGEYKGYPISDKEWPKGVEAYYG